MIDGTKVAHWRQVRGMKRTHLAAKADVAMSTLCAIERGEAKARRRTLLRIADALEVDVDLLLDSTALKAAP